jgi:hypothetical protein
MQHDSRTSSVYVPFRNQKRASAWMGIHSNQSTNAAPRMPMTAPKVSRPGTRVGTAPPVDPAGGAWPSFVALGEPVTLTDGEPVTLTDGEPVTLTDGEPVLGSEPVLTVALRESIGVTDAVTLALSRLQVLVVAFSLSVAFSLPVAVSLVVAFSLLALVLDGTVSLDVELGSSIMEATMRTSAHWSPMERS